LFPLLQDVKAKNTGSPRVLIANTVKGREGETIGRRSPLSCQITFKRANRTGAEREGFAQLLPGD
jgi:hypothetical protein